MLCFTSMLQQSGYTVWAQTRASRKQRVGAHNLSVIQNDLVIAVCFVVNVQCVIFESNIDTNLCEYPMVSIHNARLKAVDTTGKYSKQVLAQKLTR